MLPMRPWNNAQELFGPARRGLFTCVVGDVLDKLVDFRVPVEIGKVRVETGDILFGLR